MTQKNSAPKGAEENKKSGSNVNTTAAHLVRFLDAAKNSSERLRVDVKEYRGNTYIDVRVWYAADGGEYRPSSKGVTFKPLLVAELMRGLALAARSIDPTAAS